MAREGRNHGRSAAASERTSAGPGRRGVVVSLEIIESERIDGRGKRLEGVLRHRVRDGVGLGASGCSRGWGIGRNKARKGGRHHLGLTRRVVAVYPQNVASGKQKDDVIGRFKILKLYPNPNLQIM